MQYIVGTKTGIMPKIVEYILKPELCFTPSLRSPTNAVKPIVNTTKRKKLGALSVSTSLFLLRNCSFSLSKVTKEFFLTIYGTSRIVAHEVIKLRCLSFRKNVSFHPSTVKTKNITFQKLSLFSLDCKKLIFGVLGLSYIPPYSLGVTAALTTTSCRFDCLNSSTCDFGVFSHLKSSMTLLYNSWFQIYSIIISKYYHFTKQIKALILVFSFILCGNCSLVLAKNELGTKYNQEQIASLISKAEQENQIPSGLLAAIAKVESNTKAYALNINGNTILNESLEEASGVVKKKLASGLKNIDLGVMQLNYRWHGLAFNNITEMLMPENNIKYAASLLKSLRIKHGTWHKAVRYYHSAKPEHHKKYSRKVVAYWLARDRTEEKGTKIEG